MILAISISGTAWPPGRLSWRLRSVSSDSRSVGGPRHDVDQVDVVAELGDRGAAVDRVELLGDRLRAEAELAGAVLVDLDPHRLGLLAPVEVMVSAAPGVPERRPATCCAKSRAWSMVLPVTRYWTGQPTGGPSSQPGDAAGEGVHPGDGLLELRLDPGARLEVLRDDHHLRDEVVVALDVERQIEADRAAADIGRPALRRPDRPRSAPGSGRPRSGSRGSTRWPAGSASRAALGRSERREELALEQRLPAPSDSDEQEDGHADRDVAVAHADA